VIENGSLAHFSSREIILKNAMDDAFILNSLSSSIRNDAANDLAVSYSGDRSDYPKDIQVDGLNFPNESSAHLVLLPYLFSLGLL